MLEKEKERNKQMIDISKNKLYSKCNHLRIKKTGVYKRRQWFIVSYGTHPCAYVRMFKKEMKYDWEGMPIYVHGGITFCEEKPSISERWKDRYIDFNPLIGWDYAYRGDLHYKNEYDLIHDSLHAYTVGEIEKEVYSVIDQIEELKKNNYGEK